MSFLSDVLADGPVGFWLFDETSGTSAADSSGNGNTGTYQGALTLGSVGLVQDGGTSITTTGSGQYVDCPFSGITTATGLTIMDWYRHTSTSSPQIILRDATSAGGTGYFIQLDGTNIVVRAAGASRTTAILSSTVKDGNRHCFHITHSSTSDITELYIDGAFAESWSNNGTTAPVSPLKVGRNGTASNYSPGNYDAHAIFPSVLSAARILAQYNAGIASTVTGSATATLPRLEAIGTGLATIAADVASTLPRLEAVGEGVVPTPIDGVGVATLPQLTVTAEAAVPVVTGEATSTLPRLSVTATDQVIAATLPGGGAIDVEDVELLDVVVLTDVELTGGGTIAVDDLLPVVPLTDVVLPGGGTITARPDSNVSADPRTGRPQWRYVVTELDGTPLGELPRIEHDPVEDGTNEPSLMNFRIATDDPARSLIQVIQRWCEVWEGDELLVAGPILPTQTGDDGQTVTYQVHDPSWYWRGGRRVIGRVPKQNLLKNGDFTQSLKYWFTGYDAGSIPAAKPNVVVVDDDFTDGGKAAQITGVETVVQNKSVLESSAVYYPNRPFESEPLAAGFKPGGAEAIDDVAEQMPATAGLKVTIIGHTANDGTGNGIDLSLRRAQAAAARVAAIRPGAVITTKGVGCFEPDPDYPIDAAQQRRVEIIYESTETISGRSRQWFRQIIEIMQPKSARYDLQLTGAAWLKVTDDWSVEDASMTSVRMWLRRKATPGTVLQDVSQSITDTDPVERWMLETEEVTVPADGRAYLVDLFCYAPAALARYTRAGIYPGEALYFWGVDQALIVKGIVEHFQDPAMGKAWPLLVRTRTPLTGVTRDRIYPHHERMPVDTALDEWPALWRGMDLDTIVARRGTERSVTVATFFPRQGQVVDYPLVLGGNLVDATPESTRDVGSSIIAQAQDSGPARDEAYASDPAALGGMMLERVITGEQETPINELDEIAKAELGWASMATPSWWVTVHPDRVQEVLANIRKGDTVRLILDAPEPVDRLARIVKRQRHPSGLRLLLELEEG